MIYRITLQTVFDIEANNEEEAWNKIPDTIPCGDMYILDTEEVEENK